ncbi:hypothetical protein CPC08DRAFT_768340 [Agrocybe pediades]|nr:hypothetical protein CPC08DRAFT_768340 [Agrocybe pediades]
MLIRIDDRDPSIIYTPSTAWTRGGRSNEYMSTTTFTHAANAFVTYSFQGASQISVWGTIPSIVGGGQGPESSYTIDNGNPATMTFLQDPVSNQYQRIFFQSDPLTSEAHTLVITTGPSGGDFILDFIQLTYLNGTESSTTAPSSSLSETGHHPGSSAFILNTATSSAFSRSMTSSLTTVVSANPQSLTRSSTDSASTSLDPTKQSSSVAHKSLSRDVIAGIAVGILLAVIAIFVAVFCLVRRHLKRRSNRVNYGSLWTPHLQAPTAGTLSPFVLRNEAPGAPILKNGKERGQLI